MNKAPQYVIYSNTIQYSLSDKNVAAIIDNIAVLWFWYNIIEGTFVVDALSKKIAVLLIKFDFGELLTQVLVTQRASMLCSSARSQKIKLPKIYGKIGAVCNQVG